MIGGEQCSKQREQQVERSEARMNLCVFKEQKDYLFLYSLVLFVNCSGCLSFQAHSRIELPSSSLDG